MLLLYDFPSEDHYFKELQLQTRRGGMVHREVKKFQENLDLQDFILSLYMHEIMYFPSGTFR